MKKEEIFTCGQRSEDVLGWARKLDALGTLLGSVGEPAEEELFLYRQELGMIISDYSKAIHETLSEIYPDLQKAYGDIVEFKNLRRAEAAGGGNP